ncbi:MAG: phosphopantothenoylcysteine decarboxylase, partial [Cellulomonadaceae bacterium]|nr:phosphopantothenoylcysteine decarboxylase [Cellulomonadaceae bacterium]
MRIVLGVTGGIAAYKAVLLLRLLREAGHSVRVIPTHSALKFVGAPTWEALSGQPVHTSVFDDVPGVEHVQLGQSAELIIVAPATADFIARMAVGRADDLLAATVLVGECPVVLAPAMHTQMWENPATKANVATLSARGVQIIGPAQGRLTGSDSGIGRMEEPDAIFAALEKSGWLREAGIPEPA